MARSRVLGAVVVVMGALALIAPTAHAASPSTVLPYAAGGYRYQQVPHGGGSPAFAQPGFDDSSFAVGAAAFGETSVCGNVAVTPWDIDTDLLVRHDMSLPAGTKSVTVHIAIDNDIELFWNGTPVGSFTHEGCATRDSFTVTIPDDLLTAGDNLLAARAIDRGGAAFLDLKVTANLPPDCTSLATDKSMLWPPNHKLQTVTVTGGRDPEGGPLAVAVTGVTQDEALDTTADGHTTPDADSHALPTNAVRLRAERAGTGDGRVYRIAVTATDAGGASCAATLFVGVPHDHGRGHPAIDTRSVVVNSFGSPAPAATAVAPTTDDTTATSTSTTTSTTRPTVPASNASTSTTTSPPPGNPSGLNNGAGTSPSNPRARSDQHAKR